MKSYVVVEAGKEQEEFDDFPTRARARAWAKKRGFEKYSIVLVESWPPHLPTRAKANRHRQRRWSVAFPQPAPLPTRAKSKKKSKKFWCVKCAKRYRSDWRKWHGTRNKPLTPELKAIVGPERRKPSHGSVLHPFRGGLPD